jgi:hypothetical protein
MLQEQWGIPVIENIFPYLIKAFIEFDDERVRIMLAWSLGKLGGDDSLSA